jgi:hypothetical protein
MFARARSMVQRVLPRLRRARVRDLAVGLVPMALALVTIYIAVYGLAVMRGEATEPVGTFAWKMVKVGAILSFALPGLYYSGNVWPGLLACRTAWPLFVAPRAAAAATAFGALDLANTAANEQLALLWKDAGMFRLDLVLASLLFSLGTTIFLVLGAFVGLLGKLILTFALAIGPLAILCLLFKPTARFFDSWLSFVLSAVVLSWFVFFALGHVSVRLGPRCFCHCGRQCVRCWRAWVSGCPRSRRHLSGRHVPSGHRALPGAFAGIQPHRRCFDPERHANGHELDGRHARDGRWSIRRQAALQAGGGSMSRGGGAAYVAGRAAGAVGSAGGAVAGGARAAYQRVAQRGGVST